MSVGMRCLKIESENNAGAHPKAVSCPGLTRASMRSFGKEQPYEVSSLRALMDPRVKPGVTASLLMRLCPAATPRQKFYAARLRFTAFATRFFGAAFFATGFFAAFFPLRHSSLLASRAPSASASSFAHWMVGCTR